MNKAKVAEKVREAQSAKKIEPRDIVEIVTAFIFGGASGYVVEKILDNVMPETGSLPLDIIMNLGKLGISFWVGDKVAEATGQMAGDTYQTVIDLNDFIDGLFKDDNVKEVYCEATVE